MRLPPPPPPASFFAANPSKINEHLFLHCIFYLLDIRMPPNIRPGFPPNVPQSKLIRQQPPNVFSAPPSLITKPPQQTSMTPNPTSVPSKPSMTFEAKPQIRYFLQSIFIHHIIYILRARQDVTKFVPTILKIKRGGTAISNNSNSVKGPDISGLKSTSRFEDPLSMKARMGNTSNPTNQHHFMMTGLSTDDAYDTFMKEISQLV
jgi:hypothetical protein